MRFIPQLRTLCVGIVTAGALMACEDPNIDSFRRDGGASPDPTGVIRGTVLYVGPRPQCEWTGEDGERRPLEVTGNVILTLFVYDNPPPPAGSASSATSLLTIPGETMFSLNDCLPEAPTDEQRRSPIMRSAAFIWPELALGRGRCVDPDPVNPGCPGVTYQIRGFYDYDGDFNPFFSVRNLPTAGDIAGGAFVSSSAVPPVFQRIEFGHIDESPNGQVVEGVAVTLGAPVVTERPIFELGGSTRALSSTDRLPTETDAVPRENALVGLTNMRIDGIVSRARPRPTDAWQNALGAAGIDDSNYFFGSPAYGFYVLPVDVDNDGRQDPHPVLGSANIPYWFPVPIVRRARTPAEQRTGVPDVLFVGTIRPTTQNPLTSGGFPREVFDQFDVGIPPIAVMATNPAIPQCRVPIIPPGNVAETYERIPVDCQELPSGNYDINVLSGLAAAQIVDARQQCLMGCTGASCETVCQLAADGRTQTGFTHCRDNPAAMTDPMAPPRLCSGSSSGQAWSVPNDLGCPDELYRIGAVNQLDPPLPGGGFPACGDPDSRMLESQSREGGWSVVNVADEATEELAASRDDGHGVAACQRATRATTGEMNSPVTYMPVPAQCCPESLDRFCPLPLCPLRGADVEIESDPLLGGRRYSYPEAVVAGRDGARLTREMRVPGTPAGDGDYHVERVAGTEVVIPHCTPFLMPVECCRIADACGADPCAADCPRRDPAACGD